VQGERPHVDLLQLVGDLLSGEYWTS
jgi:hypothetical protein